MTEEYLDFLQKVAKREGLFIAVNIVCIKYNIPDIYENRINIGIILKHLFGEQA